MNPIESIADNDLTYELYKSGVKKAEAERQWEVIDHQRLILLAEVTGWQDAKSHAEKERLARVSDEYKAHIKERGDIRYEMTLARVKYDAISYEIRKRLSDHYKMSHNT